MTPLNISNWMAGFWHEGDFGTKDINPYGYDNFETVTRSAFLQGDCIPMSNDGGLYRFKAIDPYTISTAQVDKRHQLAYSKKKHQSWNIFKEISLDNQKRILQQVAEISKLPPEDLTTMLDLKKLENLRGNMGYGTHYDRWLKCCILVLIWHM